MTTDQEIPQMAMDVLGILWEIESHELPIAHTESARTIQRAVEWLKERGYVEPVGDDLWKITEAGGTFFEDQCEKEA
jgi:hypothetical protein